jgi:hypothetical protein
MAWNLSTPDWQNRIRTGQSLDPAMHASGAPLAADVHTIKAGINYRFGWVGQPVVARY